MTMRIVSGILAVVVVVVGVLYGVGVSNLNKANDSIANLEEQLTTEKAHAADLQTQLTVANAKVTSLTTELAAVNTKANSLTADLATATTNLGTANSRISTLTADLATANSRISTLTADLATANARVTTLSNDLAAANARVTTLSNDLATANSTIAALTADRAITNASINSLTTELAKVKSPRHFSSLSELQTWLAADDTNTMYASYSLIDRAFVLQVKALRNGYLLPASLFYDSDAQGTYVTNVAIIGSRLYYVLSANDTIFSVTTFAYTPMPQPFP